MSDRIDVIKKKQVILKYLAENGQATTNELVKYTSFSRDTIYEHCKKLIKEGFLNEKKNKFGKYSIRKSVYRNSISSGYNFCNDFFSKILDRHFYEEESYRKEIYLNRTKNESLNQKDYPESWLDELTQENQLYQYVLAIGAYITYVLIQAIKPDIVGIKSKQKKIEDRLYYVENISGKSKDEIIKDWISSSINPTRFLMEFSKLTFVSDNQAIGTFIKPPENITQILPINTERWKILSSEEKQKQIRNAEKFLNDWKKDYEKNKNKQYNPKNTSWSGYESVDKEQYKNLVDNFKNLFPGYFEKFQKIEMKVRKPNHS